MKTLILAAFALTTISTAANAQTTQKTPLESTVTLYGGYTDANNGYDDRLYAGATVDKYVDDLGLHLDVSGIDREQDGLFASIGVSTSLTQGVRGKLAFGTSTDNFNILPEYFGLAEVRIEAGRSTVVTPALAYRSFRNGIDEYLPSLDVNHYFSIPGDTGGYLVAQVRGAVAIMPDREAPSFGVGLSTIRANGLSAGVYVEGGRLSYANLIDIGAPGVNSPFYAVRPSLGYRLSNKTEIFARGEYSKNDFFRTLGAMVGLKFNID